MKISEKLPIFYQDRFVDSLNRQEVTQKKVGDEKTWIGNYTRCQHYRLLRAAFRGGVGRYGTGKVNLHSNMCLAGFPSGAPLTATFTMTV